jgi:hypothetical protein
MGDFVAGDDIVAKSWTHDIAAPETAAAMSAIPGTVIPMTHKRQLRGVELRYALTLYLFQHGPKTVAELIDALEFQGFGIPGRASKVVSDSLRREVTHGRVLRLKRGRYGPAEMPRATEYRIHQRVLALRSEAAVITSQNGDSFWRALGA